jgi:urease accessory protein
MTTITRIMIIAITKTMRMSTEVEIGDAPGCDKNALPLPLLIWLSPAFPVGGFAYSHGLEWAVEAGDVRDAASLRLWLEDLVGHGSLRNDAVLLAAAWRAVSRRPSADADHVRLAEVNELALALAPSAERYLETRAQGNAFVKAIAQAWPCCHLERLATEAKDIAYPIALGAAAADTGIDLAATLAAFTLSFQNNLVSAAVRLGTIGQNEALKLTARLLPSLQALAYFAAQTSLADLGSCAFRADIASMRHETQYSRLFRS